MATFRSYKRICNAVKMSNKHIFLVEKDGVSYSKPFIMIKHDVEKKPKKALQMAIIESSFGIQSTYYFQAYLFTEKNLSFLKKIQELGHVVSYHHDVMDQTKGNISDALSIFKKNVEWLNNNGFSFKTVCQHGNPLIEREGYNSNRDFFRSEKVKAQYPTLIDIMVNFPDAICRDYLYISDAGQKWKIIDSPTENDLPSFNGKDIDIDNLEEFINSNHQDNILISCHPHRYYKLWIASATHFIVFKFIRFLAKILIKIPFVKKWYQRNYGIAKKI